MSERDLEEDISEESVETVTEEEAEEKIEESTINDIEMFIIKSELWEKALSGRLDLGTLQKQLAPLMVSRTKPKRRVRKPGVSRRKRKRSKQ